MVLLKLHHGVHKIAGHTSTHPPSSVGKLLRLTFSSELRKPCLKTGKNLSPNKFNSVFEKISKLQGEGMLATTPSNNRMRFHREHSPVHKSILQDVEVSQITKEGLIIYWLEDFNEIMSMSSSDIGYIKVIKMDKETNPNLLPVASKYAHFPSNTMNGLENH